ncbi:MAG TPA: NAD(P)/FAD-dependent oxidoreductase [Mycobacteriales bacterium]|jgi:thioredoxin reductase|nr:NAD(P)/FAD-dependent oxidoreductase [Mycobacteriales bacterium]
MTALHDVVVVGGGAAGLAAATWLGRYRRDTVVVDSGDYRAASVETSHGYLARDPQQPMELLATAREQLAAYSTVRIQRGRVTSARRAEECFELTLDDGATLRACRVVLATGVVDACPDLENFDEHYGASAFHCPSCDGFDAADRDVIAYGWDEHLVGFSASLLDWARSVTVVTGGRRFAGDEACLDVLGRHGIELVETEATKLVGRRGALEGIELADGRLVPGSLLFFSVAHEPRTELARQLDCRIDDQGYVAVDGNGETSVSGVYAAGDLAPGMQLVQIAAAKGTIAGINAALSLHGEPGSPRSPEPAPDAPGELDQARP